MKKILILIFVIIFVYVYIQYDYNKEIISNGYSSDIDNYVNSDNYLDVLYSWASSDSKVAAIMDSKDSYPDILLMMLARNSDMLDYVSGYTKYKGEVFSDNIGKVDKGVYPLLLQYDKRWGYGIYGDDVIAVNGCGPTAVSMVVAGLTGRNDITPHEILTVYNLANERNEEAGYTIITIKGVNNTLISNEAEFLTSGKTYKCESETVSYSNETGRIETMEFKEVRN